MKKSSIIIFYSMLIILAENSFGQWTKEKANEWYKHQPWLAGCNFIPGTAINQLEMWQKETFDLPTIDRELGWAQDIGFNLIRVFLHNLLWEEDKQGFKERINKFLEVCDKHKIKVMFVLFDDCWDKNPQLGKQREPRKGVHNSGWVQAPGETILNDSIQWNRLADYEKDILISFSNDYRILIWDLYNEPGNSGYGKKTLPLLKKVFSWAREANPSQPISAGVWADDLKDLNEFQLQNSDIITYHNYGNAEGMEKQIIELQKLGRPVLCTEYMARTNNSRFETHMPILKKYKVAAINWGFVSGKTNTIFPWGSKEGTEEPELWFHDIFRKDGTPFDKKEIELIIKLTNKK